MTGALISHSTLLRADLHRGHGAREARNIGVNIALLVLSVFVAAGRF
ncbi:hypothetical protein [Streptomyces sp. TP-A0356]|nr:hypothetical protein [Streptomyces sp. TP-A0356]